MRRKVLLLLFVSPILLAFRSHAQLSTTLYSQGNGQATTQFSAAPSVCPSAASGVDVNGNAVCAPSNASNLAGQTAAITGQVLCSVTSCPAGLYQLTLYMVPTATTTAGTLAATMSYTDDAQGQTVTVLSGLSLVSKAPGFATFTFYTSGSAPVTLSTLFVGVVGSPAYALHAAVKRIS